MSTAAFEPAYVRLLRSGELADRARRSRRQMENCDLCARYCRVNRLRSIRGAVCRTGERAVVYSAGPHHGEEDCLRGWRADRSNLKHLTKRAERRIKAGKLRQNIKKQGGHIALPSAPDFTCAR